MFSRSRTHLDIYYTCLPYQLTIGALRIIKDQIHSFIFILHLQISLYSSRGFYELLQNTERLDIFYGVCFIISMSPQTLCSRYLSVLKLPGFSMMKMFWEHSNIQHGKSYYLKREKVIFMVSLFVYKLVSRVRSYSLIITTFY